MNSLTLRGVLAEIAALKGQRVDRVWALDTWCLRLDVASSAIVVSAHPRHPTLFVGPLEPAPAASFVPFVQHAALQLERGRLVEARQAGLDRVAALGFELRDRLGDPVHRQLIVELTGPAADLALVEGQVLWSGRVRERLRGDGKVGRHGEYTPPASGKMDASQADDADLMAALARSIAIHGPGPRALVHAWQGVSPSIAREILARAAKSDHLLDVVQAWRELLESTLPSGGGGLTTAKLEPTLVTRADGTTEVECFRPRDAASGEWASFSSVSAALRESYRRFRAEAGRRSAPWRALLTAIDRTERALLAVDRERVDTGTASELRRHGEAILAHAHAMPRGLSEAEIPDPVSGNRVRVRLNPRLNAAENAELYFKKARKAARRDPALAARRNDIERRREALETLREKLENGEPDSLWLEEAQALGVQLPRETSGIPAPREPADRLPNALRPRRYELGEGWEAMVGKSNRGNDVLTFDLARPEDVWMHAHQAAGSHLVLRHHEKGKEPPRSILVSAASIAAYYSKARGASKVPVLVSRKRFVRKPRKAPIGTVTVSQYETLMVAPHCPEENGR